MHPNIVLNWSAILVAMVITFMFGGLWYGPIAGKAWAKAMGMDISKKPEPAVMKKAFLLQIIGLFLLTYVMAHTVPIWRASVWGAGEDMPNYTYGFFGGFFTWLGFYVPMQLSKVAWEMRPWKIFFINTVHDFINLQIIAQVLSNWR